MRVFLAVLVLIFSLQSWTKADDISDFQIEGMSIGDSLLDYFTEAQISNSKKFYYPKSNKFVGILSNIFNKNLNTFEAIQFAVNLDTYEIVSIAGKIYKFKNNKKKCYNEMEKIFDEIILLFPNSKIVKEKEDAHDYDKSGKSLAKVYKILLKNGRIAVTCTDWAENIDISDSLKVAIQKSEFMDWINNEAYK